MRRIALFLVVAAAGCGAAATTTANSDLLEGFSPPAPPANARQVILPIVRNLMPGSDNELCTWTDMIADKDLDVKAVEGFQSLTGHHVVLYATKVMQPVGTTRVCTDEDMATFRFAAGAGGEGQAGKNEAPGNLTYRVAAGSQIVLNHHYINASTRIVDAQSAMTLYYADPGTHYIPSSSLAFVDTTLKLPPGAASLDINCKMQQDLNSWFVIPHMHHWGSHIVIDRTSGMQKDTLFDIAWADEYQFHPPEIRKAPDAPFVFNKGDTMHVHCDWQNDTGKNLTFGLEMCVAYAATIDANGVGNQACDAGQWTDF